MAKRVSAEGVLRLYRSMHRGIKQLLTDLTGTDETLFNEAEAALREMADVAVPALVNLACDICELDDVMRSVGVLMDIGDSAVIALGAGIKHRTQQGKDMTKVVRVFYFRNTYRDPDSDRPSMMRIPIESDALAAAAVASGLEIHEPQATSSE